MDVPTQAGSAAHQWFGGAAAEARAAPAADERALLQAVAAASSCLAECVDLPSAQQAACDALVQHSGLDRAYIFELSADGQMCLLRGECSRPGVDGIRALWGRCEFMVADYAEVWQPLLAGEVYESVHTERRGANAELNGTLGSVSDLMVPVMLHGQCWGCLGLDDCRSARRYTAGEIEALRTVATALAGAILQARLLGLLQGVAESTREVAAHADLGTALPVALARLRQHSGADRVFVNRCDGEAAHFWCESHREGLPPSSAGLQTGPCRHAEAHAAQRSASELVLPVVAEGRTIACIGFDAGRPRGWTDAEVAVLQGAAAAIAAAWLRSRAEQARLAAECQRAGEAEGLSHLLEGVVLATRELLDAQDFAAGLEAWLARLGQAAGADVAILIENFQAPRPEGVAHWTSQWRRDGRPAQHGPVPATADFTDWLYRLLAGETIWAHIDELKDPASVQFWRDTDCETNLLVPIALGGQTTYVLCFDWHRRQAWNPAFGTVLRTAAESLAAVLQRQTASHALAEEREARIRAERQRADEAAAHAARMERHSRLLAAVALSAEELLATRDLGATLGVVLARIGRVTHADRACLSRLEWTPDDPQRWGWQQITHEWNRPGRVRQMHSSAARFEMRRDDPTWADMLRRFASDGCIVAQLHELGEPFRSEQAALGMTWTLCHPVYAEGTVVGVAGFDFGTAFHDYDEADLSALRTVASAMSDALARQALEQRTLQAEQQRSAALARVGESLRRTAQQVAEGVSLERMLGAALLEVTAISGARSAGVHRVARAEQQLHFLAFVSGGERLDLAADARMRTWRAPVPLAKVAPWMARLHAAELWVQQLGGPDAEVFTDECCVAHRAFGHSHLVHVPLFAGDELVGVMALCFSSAEALQRMDEAHARAVGHLVATALQMAQLSEAARRALLAGERERLQRERAAELARANEVLRGALAALPGQADSSIEGEAGSEAFLARALAEIVAQVGACSAHLFRCDDEAGLMRLVGSSSQGRWSPLGEPDDPPHFRTGYPPVQAMMARLMEQRRLQWVNIADGQRRDFMLPATHRWHGRQGHQAAAFQVLAVGPRAVGLIGMSFLHATPPPEVQLELVHALGQPMALALELSRLARLAQRGAEQSAVLGERNRLAREIHDSIAQSFLAIGMQLDAAAPPPGTPAGPALRQARELAAHGLADARRAVAALRPYALNKRSLPGALRELLIKRLADSGLNLALELPTQWRPLPPDVEDHLFRITQEAVNNVLRHAAAQTLRVELTQAGGESSVLVADDGAGFEPAPASTAGGFGLEGMHQRAGSIGARIELHSRPGQGTQILVSWPAPPPEPPAAVEAADGL